MRRASTWVPLGAADLLQQQTPPCEFAFTFVADKPMPAALKRSVDDAVQQGWLRESGCMRSFLYTFTP